MARRGGLIAEHWESEALIVALNRTMYPRLVARKDKLMKALETHERLHRKAEALEEMSARLEEDLAGFGDPTLRAALARYREHKAGMVRALADVEARLNTLNASVDGALAEPGGGPAIENNG